MSVIKAEKKNNGSTKEEAKVKVEPFDYKSKYAAYNKALDDLPDNPRQLSGLLEYMNQNFKNGETHQYAFRVQTLKNLLKGLDEMKDELCAAVQKDLGKGEFMTIV